jgi:hypothetical protein
MGRDRVFARLITGHHLPPQGRPLTLSIRWVVSREQLIDNNSFKAGAENGPVFFMHIFTRNR